MGKALMNSGKALEKVARLKFIIKSLNEQIDSTTNDGNEINRITEHLKFMQKMLA